jgi:hypothetical protein
LLWGKVKASIRDDPQSDHFEIRRSDSSCAGDHALDRPVYLKDKYFQINQAEANHSVAGSSGIDVLPNSDGRFSRVHVLLSSMK